jgi:aspartyl-tRNA synthetase
VHPYRTHSCGELGRSQCGQTVRLAGSVHRTRGHGGVLFIDLRDAAGITQLIVGPESPCAKEAGALSRESLISVIGQVVERKAEQVNATMATGEIEIPVQHLSVLSEAQALPFPVDDEHPVGEATRLVWRFLDLRRSALHQRIEARATIITAIRQRLEAQGFVEISTPILTSSSPEGARDFLVPSRLHPGSFFALPQAPQQYKQLLRASGFELYYQIAPCSATRTPVRIAHRPSFTSWTSRWLMPHRKKCSAWWRNC